MGNQYNFLQAGLDETIFHVPDPAKVTISQNKINSQNSVRSSNGTMIIYQPKEGEDLTVEYQETINKMIIALQLELDETIKLNFNKIKHTHFQQLIKNHSIKYLICFGILPTDLTLHVSVSKYEHFAINGIRIIFADHVEDLNKSKLWKILQRMYQLI